jgi:nucleotide-binding universal stress UspA family protein
LREGQTVEEETLKPVVVVGIDGSHQSGEALRWADGYVRAVGGELRAVIAWEYSPGFGFVVGGRRLLESEAEQTLERVIDKYVGGGALDEVTTRIVEGNPTSVLLEESASADLLVVGDRGYGGVAGLLLGSVGARCVRDAKCSVVVVRGGPSHGQAPVALAEGS